MTNQSDKSVSLLSTSSATFSDIVSNGKIYRVPPYQRDYSWKEEHWEDLWNDILSVFQDGSTHYMGSIVLQNKGNKQFTIIDGQQRLATLSIIALATLEMLQHLVQAGVDSKSNTQRIEILFKKFLGSQDPASLRSSSKLFLNEANDKFYQLYLLQRQQPPALSRLKDAEKLLWKAFSFFKEKLQAKFIDETNSIKGDGETLTRFLNEAVAEQLIFIQIVVQDELSAYTVFETLNARGTELTVTDLLKNYIFSLAQGADVDMQHIKMLWNDIIALTDLDRFPTFLRHFWNSQNELVRKDGLFKAVKRNVHQRSDAFRLLESLQRYANIYDALGKPYDSLWNDSKDRQEYIQALDVFKVTQPFPLLMVAFEQLPEQEFTRLLRMCVVIAFRYNVISGLNPNQMESAYNKAAIKVHKGIHNTAQSIFQDLKDIYPEDERFKAAFAAKTLHAKRYKPLVRYILYAIENALNSSIQRPFATDKGTIEHILPESPSESWSAFFSEEDQGNFIHRLGNYTLLEEAKNRDCTNLDFQHKREIYAHSQYLLSSATLDYDEWNPSSMKQRQEMLAKKAATIWRIDS
jgi:uncharacterized protein with ParB-like and HNH nuclease domain